MQLDPVIHPVGRLKICAALSAAGATEGDVRYEMRFAHLREVTGLSDTTLSKQLSALEEHGYITRFREYGSTRAKDSVWVALTDSGTQAYTEHVEALKAMTEGL